MKEKTKKAKELLLSKPCDRCGNADAIYVEDPYDAEMFDNHDKHWLCYNCLEELDVAIPTDRDLSKWFALSQGVNT